MKNDQIWIGACSKKSLSYGMFPLLDRVVQGRLRAVVAILKKIVNLLFNTILFLLHDFREIAKHKALNKAWL